MRRRQNNAISAAGKNLSIPYPEPHAKAWMRLASRLFSGQQATESVMTSVFFHANPETVWQRMLSYEEVPTRPPLILRALLPLPLRTVGDKTSLGAAVQCHYGGGDLVKQITTVEPPHLLAFEVTQQRLGIESCITAIGGSYRIQPCGARTEIVLTTNYHAYLQPRWIWRPLEQSLAHLFHRHILEGMRDILPRLRSSTHLSKAANTALESAPEQEPTCTISE
jgi:hypothetical protein